MRSGAALLWKEWREIRWFLVAGAAIFIGWPLLEAVGNYLTGRGFYSADMPEVMALLLGGPFAILVAVGVTCRDLKEEITCFWQSRPVSIRRWSATKYLTGLTVVLVVLCVPLVMKIFIMRAEHELGQLSSILTCHTFTVILIYSISFLAGCLIRTPVYAVIFSGALALLVYFLPILAPPLEGLSVFNIMMESPVQIVRLSQLSKLAQGEPWIAEKMRVVKIPWADDLVLRYNIDLLRYIAFALAGSFAGVVLSVVAVRRNWRLKIGQKLMFWLLGGVGMLLFLTVVFQLRSNLTCVRQIPKPGNEKGCNVEAIVCDGDKGVLLLSGREPQDATETHYSLMTFDLSAKEPFGEEIVLPRDLTPTVWQLVDRGKLVWSAKNPQWAYLIKKSWSKNETDGKDRVDKVELMTISLTKGDVMTVVDKLDILPYLGDKTTLWCSLYMLDSTIYASTGDKLLIFDVSSDGKPVLRKVINEELGIHDGIGRGARKQIRASMSVRLVPADGFSTEERLKITVGLTGYCVMASEGDIIVVADYDFPLTMYRLKEVKDDIATLEMIGHCRPTPLERFVGLYPMQISVRDGLAYVVGPGLGGLAVYDVRQPQQIRRIGHYTAPNEWFQVIAPLPDGNILVGGNKLHIVAPPKVKR